MIRLFFVTLKIWGFKSTKGDLNQLTFIKEEIFYKKMDHMKLPLF